MNWLAVCVLAVAGVIANPSEGQPAGRGRALVIGIDRYSAVAERRTHVRSVPGREWRDLGGAVRDARAMAEMLVCLYGFAKDDIVILTNEEATRAAILAELDRLASRAEAGDAVVFHFSGHGSRVKNSRSDELDRMDESRVPADSRLGAPDIRDKELRLRFNRILDRGARLTVVLDSCYSGSGARGLATGETVRGLAADPRDVADRSPAGPLPEERGALVLSAAEDFGLAFETTDENGQRRGAFSWAWIQAMRAAEMDEPALETFLRARARLGTMLRHQRPVIAGDDAARARPFPGIRSGRPLRRSIVAVETVRADGVVALHGGWLNGLTVGSELLLLGHDGSGVRLEVTALEGLSRAEARITSGSRAPIGAGALVEVVSWEVPPGRALRVAVPRIAAGAVELSRLARTLSKSAAQRGIRWIGDPTVTTPDHLLRWNGGTWELLRPGTPPRAVDDPVATLATIRRGARLFVQWPVPDAVAQRVGAVVAARLGQSSLGWDGPDDRVLIARVERTEEADYVLAGRFDRNALEYAWVRPWTTVADAAGSALPVRSDWQSPDTRQTPTTFAETVFGLQRILAWQLLESPPEAPFAYRLAIRRAKDREPLTTRIEEGEVFGIALRLRAESARNAASRYVYAFLVDSFGRSTLLYPRDGSVENSFPLGDESGGPPPDEIPLGAPAAFTAGPPYGTDTYFLLTTDEPLSDPWILAWGGVRTREAVLKTPLDHLLAGVGAPDRSARRLRTVAGWSIERTVIQTIPRPERRSSP